MIDAKELRIGNVISVGDLKTGTTTMMRGAKTIFDVCAITQSQIHIHQINNMGFGTIALSEAEGVPLTKEILVNSGFTIREDGCYSHNNTNMVKLDPNGDSNFKFGDDFWGMKAKLPKYVHQLQNFYYMIAEKELKIKL